MLFENFLLETIPSYQKRIFNSIIEYIKSLQYQLCTSLFTSLMKSATFLKVVPWKTKSQLSPCSFPTWIDLSPHHLSQSLKKQMQCHCSNSSLTSIPCSYHSASVFYPFSRQWFKNVSLSMALTQLKTFSGSTYLTGQSPNCLVTETSILTLTTIPPHLSILPILYCILVTSNLNELTITWISDTTKVHYIFAYGINSV